MNDINTQPETTLADIISRYITMIGQESGELSIRVATLWMQMINELHQFDKTPLMIPPMTSQVEVVKTLEQKLAASHEQCSKLMAENKRLMDVGTRDLAGKIKESAKELADSQLEDLKAELAEAEAALVKAKANEAATTTGLPADMRAVLLEAHPYIGDRHDLPSNVNVLLQHIEDGNRVSLTSMPPRGQLRLFAGILSVLSTVMDRLVVPPTSADRFKEVQKVLEQARAAIAEESTKVDCVVVRGTLKVLSDADTPKPHVRVVSEQARAKIKASWTPERRAQAAERLHHRRKDQPVATADAAS